MSYDVLENKRGVRIEFVDKSPGIKNIQETKKDVVSTAPSSLGVSLELWIFFTIESNKTSNTKIQMSKWLPISDLNIEYGIVNLLDQHYSYNGDGYVIKEYGGDCINSNNRWLGGRL